MSVNAPNKIVALATEIAINKGKATISRVLVLSFLAGVYISFGGLLSVIIGGGVPGIVAQNPGIARFLFGAAFPLGLMLVVLSGAELFTGNNAYFATSVLSGKHRITDLLKNWGLVYVGNFVGSVFIAFFLVHLTGLVSASPWSQTVANIGLAKTSGQFHVIFLKGIGANWLVCLALWLGMSATQTSGKILGLWWPVMAFVAFGFEHSVANMFFIPLAIFEGADISWVTFLISNLIPATLGNIVGGAFFVGALYWYAYSSNGQS